MAEQPKGPCPQSGKAALAQARAEASRAASPWVRQWAADLPDGSRVLDVACGNGRHLALFAELGHAVTGVDRDIQAAEALELPEVRLVQADLEGQDWPLADQRFDAVVVTNYLWRPLFPQLRAAVGAKGRMIYETFMVGHEEFGRPRNPDFLLREGELLAEFGAEWDVLGFAEGPEGEPATSVRQRICARRTA